MELRRYKILTWGITGKNGQPDEITEYRVTDEIDSDPKDKRPFVASFPVDAKYPADVQLHHARQFRDYLNKIQEATEQAYEQNMIVDILKK